jgi:hypothetical protein
MWAGVKPNPGATVGGRARQGTLQIRVTGGQHGGKARGLHLPSLLFARLLKMPVGAHGFQRAFAVHFLFQAAQGFVNRLAFLEFDFAQFKFTSSQNPESGRGLFHESGGQVSGRRRGVNGQIWA